METAIHRCAVCGLPDSPEYGDPHECPPGFAHRHRLAPENPVDGQVHTCTCGFVAEFVVLDDGLPGEWVQTSRD